MGDHPPEQRAGVAQTDQREAERPLGGRPGRAMRGVDDAHAALAAASSRSKWYAKRSPSSSPSRVSRGARGEDVGAHERRAVADDQHVEVGSEPGQLGFGLAVAWHRA